jgi:hypothetical protein
MLQMKRFTSVEQICGYTIAREERPVLEIGGSDVLKECEPWRETCRPFSAVKTVENR